MWIQYEIPPFGQFQTHICCFTIDYAWLGTRKRSTDFVWQYTLNMSEGNIRILDDVTVALSFVSFKITSRTLFDFINWSYWHLILWHQSVLLIVVSVLEIAKITKILFNKVWLGSALHNDYSHIIQVTPAIAARNSLRLHQPLQLKTPSSCTSHCSAKHLQVTPALERVIPSSYPSHCSAQHLQVTPAIAARNTFKLPKPLQHVTPSSYTSHCSA